MSIDENNINSENGMGSTISSDQKPVSSPLPGDQGTEKKEEVQSESGEKATEEHSGEQQQQVDLELPDVRRDDKQQPGESGCPGESPKLQHDRCGSDESRDGKFKPDGQFWEFIERQQKAWDKYHSQRKSELIPGLYFIDLLLCEAKPEAPKKKNRRRKKNKKKWFKKKSKKDKFHYIFL